VRSDDGGPAALGVAALGFFCFMPYPALPVGGSTALQMGNVLTALAVLPVLLTGWLRRPSWLFVLLIAPLCVSALKLSMSEGRAESVLGFKSVVVWAASCLTLVATQLHAPRYARWLLTGIAAATIVHVAVGALQFYTFSSGVFPLTELYVNPSFLSVQENADIIARYTQRPFGLFPEPSAMTSSLAPWVLFWTAEWCGLVRLREPPLPWQRALFAVATVGGLGLMILSRSGHTAVTTAAVLLLIMFWVARCRATWRTYAVLVVGSGVVLPAVLWLAAMSVGDRIGGRSSFGNSSWEERATSMVVGLRAVADGDVPTVVFGLGPGMAAVRAWESDRIEAVWSVLLTYLYETGLVGGVAIVVAGAYLLGVWRAAGWSLTFAAITAVWLVGVTITTSYEQLLPIWMALGWLTVWPAICAPVTRPAAQRALREPGSGANDVAQGRRWVNAAGERVTAINIGRPTA
jgi:hypothetical protein